MKINLLFFILLASYSQAVAQSDPDPVYTYNRSPRLKLYKATTKPILGEKIRDILYAVTDSTVVYVDTDPATIQQIKLGNVPELKTIKLAGIRRVTVSRRGHFWRGVGWGVGLSAATWLIATSSRPSDIGAAVLKEVAIYFIAPLALLSGIVGGILPEKYKPTRCTESI